jgi:peroxiredoxin family protein
VPGRLVVFLHSGSWEARYQATTLALTAAALGDEVTVALFFAPLRSWAEGRFDEGAPPEAKSAKVASLRTSLEEARAGLGLRMVACDTAMRLAGLSVEAARAALDEVTTLPALWRLAQAGRAVTL